MSRPSVGSLVRAGRIERATADAEAARGKLEEARRHLDSAAAIASDDPAGAYALLYDAARKALDAHMLTKGYRVGNGRLGAHEATAAYAEAALGGGNFAEDARRFDRMRRNRNRSEYGVWQVGASTVARDLEHARRIVQAVREAL